METLYLAGVIIGGFLSFVLFTKPGKTTADLMLACWLATSAVMLLSVYNLQSGQYVNYPALAIQGLWIPLVQGPFLFLYIKYQTRPLPFQKKDLLHFLPFALGYLLFSPFYFMAFDAKIHIIENQAAGFEWENKLRVILIYLSGLIYIPVSGYQLLSFRKSLRHQFSNTEKINFRWLLYLLIGMGCIWIALFVMQSDVPVFSATVIFVFWTGYFGIRQVNVFSEKKMGYAGSAHPAITDDTDPGIRTAAPASPVKYIKSSLDEERTGKLYEKLRVVLQEQKPYLNPELTLTELAAMAGASPNLVSQVINVVEKKTFYELINDLRVKEFLRQAVLPENKKYTLLTIAYECGFNSKASFQRNFRKSMGASPREYLKREL